MLLTMPFFIVLLFCKLLFFLFQITMIKIGDLERILLILNSSIWVVMYRHFLQFNLHGEGHGNFYRRIEWDLSLELWLDEGPRLCPVENSTMWGDWLFWTGCSENIVINTPAWTLWFCWFVWSFHCLEGQGWKKSISGILYFSTRCFALYWLHLFHVRISAVMLQPTAYIERRKFDKIGF